MTSHPNKLAELAAPTRGRVKYAPLTAGLLARKGEALPATPYFGAEALDLFVVESHAGRHEPVQFAAYSEPASSARRLAPVSAEEHHHQSPRTGGPWRIRRPVLPEARADAQPTAQHSLRAQSRPPADSASDAREPTGHVTVSLDIELSLAARLAAHAHRTACLPARIVEEALSSHLSTAGEVCPACARSLGETANRN